MIHRIPREVGIDSAESVALIGHGLELISFNTYVDVVAVPLEQCVLFGLR